MLGISSNALHVDDVPRLDLARIRKTNEWPPRVSIIDLIAVISGVVNPRKTWMDFKYTNIPLVDEYCTVTKFPGPGCKNTPVIKQTDILKILDSLLARLRIPMQRKLEILNRSSAPLMHYTEIEIHAKLQKALAQFKSVGNIGSICIFQRNGLP